MERKRSATIAVDPDRDAPAACPEGIARELPATWRFNFKSIDDEHQQLIDDLNAGWSAFGPAASAPFDRLKTMFVSLKGNMLLHFESEEAEMAALGYPGLRAHKEQHRSAIERLKTIEAGAAAFGIVRREDLYALLDTLVDDMLRADVSFKTFLFARGLIHID